MISKWRPRSVAFRLLRADTPALAPVRTRYLWLTPPGAADQGARLRVWEYEGGTLGNEP